MLMHASVDILKARCLRFMIFCIAITAFLIFPSNSNADVRIEEKVGKLLVKEFDLFLHFLEPFSLIQRNLLLVI